MLDAYIRAFSHLQPPRAPFHWTAARKSAPFKALLLLAVSDLVAEGIIDRNFIAPDGAVADRFGRYWTVLTGMQARQANLEVAFLGLADDGFWRLQAKPRLLVGAQSIPNRASRPQHLQDTAGASFDTALFDYLRQGSSRYLLQQTLIESYISPAQQERLSAVRRVFVTQAGGLIGKAGGNGPHMLASGETSTDQLSKIADDVAQRSAVEHDESSESQWDNHPMGAFLEQGSDDAGDWVGMVHYDMVSVSVLSAVFLDPEVLKQAVFARSLATSSGIEMRTPAGTRQIALGWNTLEHMPLISGHLSEKLSTGGYDLGADWSFTLDFSVRVANVLHRHSIRTVGELAGKSLEDLLVLRSFGPDSLGEVMSALRAELWPHLTGFTLDELVPSYSPEKSASTASDLGGGTVPVGDPSAPAADVNLSPRGQPANSLFADDDQVLAAPQAYGPLLSHEALAGLRAVGCEVVRIEVRRVLLGGPDSEWGDGRVRVRTANVLARKGLETLVDVVLRTPSDLLDIRQFGPECYRALCQRVRIYLAPWLAHLSPELLAARPLEGISQAAEGSRAVPSGSSVDFDAPTQGQAGRAEDDAGAELPAPAQPPRTTFDRLRAALSISAEASDPDALRKGADEIATLLDGVSVEALLDELKDRVAHLAGRSRRQLYVLFSRAGVYDGAPKTLLQLGGRLGVTRERVRQLELGAQSLLSEPAMQRDTAMLGVIAQSALEALGGVARVQDVADYIARLVPFGAVDLLCTTRLVASWSLAVRHIQGDRLALNVYPDALIERAEMAIRETLEAHPAGLPFDDFVSRMQLAGGDDLLRAGRAFVAAMASCSDQVDVVEGTCQPAKRGSLYARIVTALRSLGQPAHFTEIAAVYRRLNPDDAKRTDNSVHAFMDRFHDVFVLVGHGTFALANWGYDPAIRDVAGVAEDVLRRAERPLHRDEVVWLAGERYRWKANSVAAALGTDKRIRAFGNGFFGLDERAYGPFDPEAAYVELFGVQKSVKTATVAGVYTNARGNIVTHLRLTPSMLPGGIPLSNKHVRECFAEAGDTIALCCGPSGVTTVKIHRANSAISGLGAWFAAAGARAGDELLIERLRDATADEPRYFVVHAPDDWKSEAMRLVALDPDGRTLTLSGGALQVLGARNLEAVRRLAWHALAHPWTEISAAQSVLGLASAGTQGSEYQRLGVRCGVLADGQVPGRGDGIVFRPTREGRAWAALEKDRGDTRAVQDQLVLRLPAYRRHLRGVPTGEEQPLAPLSPLVTASWDQRLGLTPGTPDAGSLLDSTAALLLVREVQRDALTLLLLLLAAQSHGLGVALDAPALGRGTAEAADHLRAHGIVLVMDASGCAALDERVMLGVDDAHVLERRLRGIETPAATALADAWQALQTSFTSEGNVCASDLFLALQTQAPELVQDVLAAAPESVSDAARYTDGALAACGFPRLVGDASWAREHVSAPFAFWRDAQARASDPLRAPLGVCLCEELLQRSWDVPRHLGANAHLALLTGMASDLGGLAERVRRSDTGWTLDGEPLVAGLDRALRALGYDVWDERYRDDPSVSEALGEALVALGERLDLLRSDGPSVAAVGSLASDVYYGVYYAEQDLLGRVRESLARVVVP